MESDKQQKELFDFEKPKRVLPRLRDIFPKADFENNIAVTLTLDKLILAFIGILMLMVVVYAAGVEMGRREFKEVALKARSPRQISMKSAPSTELEASRQKWLAERPYSVLIATFADKKNALAETARLKRSGYSPLAIHIGNYIYVYSGAYRTKNDAIKDIIKLKKSYRDAVIKIR